MIYVLRQCGLCAGRAVILTACRGVASTPVCLIRGRVHPHQPRRLSTPKVGSLVKDSDFTDVEDDSVDLDVNTGQLQSSYESDMKEMKKEKNKLWKILTKKKMENRPKAPNMLTSSEREHIRFLHESDPEEWTPERLSQSFPALPHVIKKILKKKWTKDTLEGMKEMDANVLENWEKLKRNELEAEPAVLRHLKKFINRRDSLKSQLDNPRFFPEPATQKKVTWGDGPLSKLLTKYEREVEQIKTRQLISPGSGSAVAVQEEKRVDLIEEVKIEAESRKTEESFTLGRVNRRDVEVTLDDLKKNILEKTESKKKLSRFEESVLNKTLGVGENVEKVRVETREPKKEKKVNPVLEGILKQAKKEVEKTDKTLEEVTDFREDQTRSLSDKEVGLYLGRIRGEAAIVDEKQPEVTKQKTPVNYYETEKDKEVVAKNVDLLSDSCFWGSNQRRKSKDAMDTLPTKSSPHLSPTMKTYFTYDYPERIEIPEEKWQKGKTYRVKDCYYDDDGEFLYRVPGVATDK